MSEKEPIDPNLEKLFSGLEKSEADIIQDHDDHQDSLKDLETIASVLQFRCDVAQRHLVEHYDVGKLSPNEQVTLSMFHEGERRAVRRVLSDQPQLAADLFAVLGWSQEAAAAVGDDVVFGLYELDQNVLLDVSPGGIEHIESALDSDDPSVHTSFAYQFKPRKGHQPVTLAVTRAKFRYGYNGDHELLGSAHESYVDTHQAEAMATLLAIITPELTQYYKTVRGIND